MGLFEGRLCCQVVVVVCCLEHCVARMEELAEVFGGRQQLSRVVASKKLEVGEKFFVATLVTLHSAPVGRSVTRS